MKTIYYYLKPVMKPVEITIFMVPTRPVDTIYKWFKWNLTLGDNCLFNQVIWVVWSRNKCAAKFLEYLHRVQIPELQLKHRPWLFPRVFEGNSQRRFLLLQFRLTVHSHRKAPCLTGYVSKTHFPDKVLATFLNSSEPKLQKLPPCT